MSSENYLNFEASQNNGKMKTIYVIRHAKSSWDTPNLIDHERPLLEKGIKRTKLVGEYLVKNNIKTGLLISSDAVRALETSKLIAEAIGYPAESIKTDHRIYHEGANHVYDVLNEVPQNIDSVMIVGHNPTLTDFINDFLDKEMDWLPTSGMVSFSFETDEWKEIAGLRPITNFVISPRLLKENAE